MIFYRGIATGDIRNIWSVTFRAFNGWTGVGRDELVIRKYFRYAHIVPHFGVILLGVELSQ